MLLRIGWLKIGISLSDFKAETHYSRLLDFFCCSDSILSIVAGRDLHGCLDESSDCARHSWFSIDAVSSPPVVIIGRLLSTVQIWVWTLVIAGGICQQGGGNKWDLPDLAAGRWSAMLPVELTDLGGRMLSTLLDSGGFGLLAAVAGAAMADLKNGVLPICTDSLLPSSLPPINGSTKEGCYRRWRREALSTASIADDEGDSLRSHWIRVHNLAIDLSDGLDWLLVKTTAACVDGEDAFGVGGTRRIWKRWSSLCFWSSSIVVSETRQNGLSSAAMVVALGVDDGAPNWCSSGAQILVYMQCNIYNLVLVKFMKLCIN
ncbi:hypothetical protein ACLOJK_008009 [Asimina triloba]